MTTTQNRLNYTLRLWNPHIERFEFEATANTIEELQKLVAEIQPVSDEWVITGDRNEFVFGGGYIKWTASVFR